MCNRCMFWHHESKYADPGGPALYGVGLRSLVCWDCVYESIRGHK